MPQMGVSVAEGTIAEWRKEPGDWVEADETVCEVTTDKIDVEIPAPASGAWRGSSPRPGDGRGRRRRSPRSTGGAKPGEAHPAEDRGAGAGPARTRRTGRGSTRRSSAASRTSTGSTWIRSREAESAGGFARRTSWRSSRTASRREGLHTESPYRPESRPRSGDRHASSREPMSADAQGDRRAHGREPLAPRPTARRSSRSTCRASRRRATSCARPWRGAASSSPTSRSSPRPRSRRSASCRSSTPRSTARRSSTTTTSTSGSPSRSTTG